MVNGTMPHRGFQEAKLKKSWFSSTSLRGSKFAAV
jgi:hypothetical protein